MLLFDYDTSGNHVLDMLIQVELHLILQEMM